MYAVVLCKRGKKDKKTKKVVVNVVEDYKEALYIVKELYDFVEKGVSLCIKNIKGDKK